MEHQQQQQPSGYEEVKVNGRRLSIHERETRPSGAPPYPTPPRLRQSYREFAPRGVFVHGEETAPSLTQVQLLQEHTQQLEYEVGVLSQERDRFRLQATNGALKRVAIGVLGALLIPPFTDLLHIGVQVVKMAAGV